MLNRSVIAAIKPINKGIAPVFLRSWETGPVNIRTYVRRSNQR